MKKSATSPSVLIARAAPAHLLPFVSAFVCREEAVRGEVVRLLPETRMSVQLMLGDPYWIRERDKGAPWRAVPPISLWAPRSDWGYGYAASFVKAYAFALTPAGFAALLGRPVNTLCNQVLDAAVAAGLPDAVRAREGELFESWIDRTVTALGALFARADPKPAISPEALCLLAAEGGGAVAAAAATDGVSLRQFRRRFAVFHGFSPKRYQRAIRVDRMLRQLHPAPWEADPLDPAPIAFTDQPHAIREFRKLTGLTPKAYQRSKAAGDRTLRSLAAPDISPPLAAFPAAQLPERDAPAPDALRR